MIFGFRRTLVTALLIFFVFIPDRTSFVMTVKGVCIRSEADFFGVLISIRTIEQRYSHMRIK